VLWRSGLDSSAALRVQLGKTLDGDQPVWLDLRDIDYGGHGCHGLLVGSGWGAAQLWQSMVMSLARTCSPEALRMWLVLPGLESPEQASNLVGAIQHCGWPTAATAVATGCAPLSHRVTAKTSLA
jgi:hypothetical protein